MNKGITKVKNVSDKELKIKNIAQLLPIVRNKPFYPISMDIQGIWMIGDTEYNTQTYNISNLYRLKGNIDISIFIESIHNTIKRHEIFRNAFKYFADDPIFSSTWSGLTNTQKEQWLIYAYRWIQRQPFFNIPASSTSQIVKNAQMELAKYSYSYAVNTEERRALYAQGVREFQLSKWMEKLEKGGFPDFIRDMLDDELEGLGGYFPTASRELDQGT